MDDAAATVSRNVWIIAQVRGYTSKLELARAMGWDRSRLSRTLSGDRQWTVTDLDTVARVLGLASPGDLFRPLADLMGAVDPTGTGSADRAGAVTDMVTGRYASASHRGAYPLAPVIPLQRDYRTVTYGYHERLKNAHTA